MAQEITTYDEVSTIDKNTKLLLTKDGGLGQKSIEEVGNVINGTGDISGIGDGTVKGAIRGLNDEIFEINLLGWYVPKACPYQNVIDGNGILHQNVGRVVLNGTENWCYHTSALGKSGSFYIDFNAGQKSAPDGSNGYFTRFKTGPLTSDMKAFVGSNSLQLRVDDCTASTFPDGISKIKQWLSQNNTVVFYELSKEKIIS